MTVVEGVTIESDRKPSLIADSEENKSKACKLCRLNLKRITYTDVLILSQFLGQDNKILAIGESGLCGRKYYLVKMLINQAQRCNLLPRPDDFPFYGDWEFLNTYIEKIPRYRDRPFHIIQKHYWE